MPAPTLFALAIVPLRCLPSDLTNPFVGPGVFAGLGWISTMLIAVLLIAGAPLVRRAQPGRFEPWFWPALRWLATVLVALAAPILIADGWIWLQALHFIPWCAPPGAFSDTAKDAQLTRLEVASYFSFFAFLAGVSLAALGYVAARQRLGLGLGRSGRAGLGAAPATRTAGGR